MLRLFTPVAIVCDRTMLREADALRGVLESFRLQVDFHYFVVRFLISFYNSATMRIQSSFVTAQVKLQKICT